MKKISLIFLGALCIVPSIILSEEPHYYLDDGYEITPIADPTDTHQLTVDEWQIRLYRRGQAKGGRDNWGLLVGNSPEDVINQLHREQEIERQQIAYFRLEPNSIEDTTFNAMGPIAAAGTHIKNKKERVEEGNKELIKRFKEFKKAFKDSKDALKEAMFLLGSPKAQNGSIRISGFFSTYIKLLKDAEIRALKFEEKMREDDVLTGELMDVMDEITQDETYLTSHQSEFQEELANLQKSAHLDDQPVPQVIAQIPPGAQAGAVPRIEFPQELMSANANFFGGMVHSVLEARDDGIHVRVNYNYFPNVPVEQRRSDEDYTVPASKIVTFSAGEIKGSTGVVSMDFYEVYASNRDAMPLFSFYFGADQKEAAELLRDLLEAKYLKTANSPKPPSQAHIARVVQRSKILSMKSSIAQLQSGIGVLQQQVLQVMPNYNYQLNFLKNDIKDYNQRIMAMRNEGKDPSFLYPFLERDQANLDALTKGPDSMAEYISVRTQAIEHSKAVLEQSRSDLQRMQQDLDRLPPDDQSK